MLRKSQHAIQWQKSPPTSAQMDFALRNKFYGPIRTGHTVPCSARQEAGKKWACGGAKPAHAFYNRKLVYTCMYCNNRVKLDKIKAQFVHTDKKAQCETDSDIRRQIIVQWMQPRISTLCTKTNDVPFKIAFPGCIAVQTTLVVPEQCLPVDTDLVVLYNNQAIAGIFVERQCVYRTLLPMYTLTVTDKIVASVNTEAVPQHRHQSMIDRWVILAATRSGRSFPINNWSECINCMRWSCHTVNEQIYPGCKRGHSPFKCELDCRFHNAFTFHTHTLIKCCNT
jgi:hypothetical protein